jgi:acyl phosphate:glycerol-3-phosphate acyltransferase
MMLSAVDTPLIAATIAAFVFGYLCGTIPFGVLLTRLAGTPDIRSVGSGNIGATNVLRTGRKALAAATLLGDMLKGTVAVVVVLYFLDRNLALLAGLGAFVGHIFPIWLRFKGGKGVATYIGVLLGLTWIAALAFCVVWLLVAAITRYSSLSALIASAATPPALWAMGSSREALLFAILTTVLWLKHRDNITRLLRGAEGKIGQKAPAAPEA